MSPLRGEAVCGFASDQYRLELDQRFILNAHPYAPNDEPRTKALMDPIAHLALTCDDNAKLTPLEVLADFADATRGWVYLERDSRHYADEKDRPALVLRHWRDGTPSHVDVAFATDPDERDTVHLVILDVPDEDETLSKNQRAALLEAFLEALRGYLGDRPDQVTLHVERDRLSPATS